MNKIEKWQTLFISVLFLLMSCTSDKLKKPDLINDSFPESQAELRKVVNSIVKDAETANIEGLKTAHLISDKFTKFGPRNFNRQNVTSTNKSEEAFFGSITWR